MTVPSLFLLGAPKCATTSLYGHLSRHPGIICPTIKEPGYFSRDEVRAELRLAQPHQNRWANYVALYESDDPARSVGCDGSTSYLGSPAALTEIQARVADPRAVAVVRDPVDLVASYYGFLRHEGWEDQATLEQAWAVQDDRRAGRLIPAAARRPKSVVYADVALQGAQIRQARSILGDRLLVFSLDDLRRRLSEVSQRVQHHAGVAPMDLGDLPRLNAARDARLGWLNHLVTSPPPVVASVRDGIKRRLHVSSLGLNRRIRRMNSRPATRAVSPRLRSRLRDHFRDDVVVLAEELDRDLLTEWGWQ